MLSLVIPTYNEQENIERVVSKEFYDYPFYIYEYKHSSPIVSYIQTNIKSVENIDEELIFGQARIYEGLKERVFVESETKIESKKSYEELELIFERHTPDELVVYFEYVPEGIVIFKESYDSSWGAFDLDSGEEQKIYRVGPGMMGVFPKENSGGIVFKQRQTGVGVWGLILTLIGLILAVLTYLTTKYPLDHNNPVQGTKVSSD